MKKKAFFSSFSRWTVQHFPRMFLIFPNYCRPNIKILNSTKEPNRDCYMTGNSMNYTLSYTTMANSNHSWLFPSPNYEQSNHKTYVKILSVKVPSWEKFRNSCTKNHCSASSFWSSHTFRRMKSVNFDYNIWASSIAWDICISDFLINTLKNKKQNRNN